MAVTRTKTVTTTVERKPPDKPPGQGGTPPGQAKKELQDAVNAAYLLVQKLHRREASDYPERSDEVQTVYAQLETFQTVDQPPEPQEA